MTGRRAATKRRNSAALIAAAAELFIERGYQGVGIEAIAERAGLTTGAIYSLFGAKHGLLIAVLADRLDQTLAATGALGHDPTAEEIVRTYARAYHSQVTSADGHRILRLELESMALVMHEATVQRQLADHATRQTAELATLLTGSTVGAGARLDDSEATTIASALLALLSGLSAKHAVRPESTDLTLWENAATALLTLTSGHDSDNAGSRVIGSD